MIVRIAAAGAVSLHDAAGVADPAAFGAMVAHAVSKGWSTIDGKAVRAHLA